MLFPTLSSCAGLYVCGVRVCVVAWCVTTLCGFIMVDVLAASVAGFGATGFAVSGGRGGCDSSSDSGSGVEAVSTVVVVYV